MLFLSNLSPFFQERQTASVASCAPCAFRISSEGLPLILPYITKQILYASPVDVKHLLQYKSIKFSDFVDAEFGVKASGLMLGCCVIVLSKGTYIASCAQGQLLLIYVYNILYIVYLQVANPRRILLKQTSQQQPLDAGKVGTVCL